MNYDRKTYVGERGVLVSTVRRDVGAYGRALNTMLASDGVVREGSWSIETEVFAASGPTWNDVTDGVFLYHENHDDASDEALDAAHERIVAGVRAGSLPLRPLQGSLAWDEDERVARE